MNEEQREFKIKKITHYEEEIKKENKSSVINTLLLGINALGIILPIAQLELSCIMNNPSIQQKENIDYSLLLVTITIVNSLVAAIDLHHIIESISRKTMLESKIEDIKNELGIEEEDKNKKKVKKL